MGEVGESSTPGVGLKRVVVVPLVEFGSALPAFVGLRASLPPPSLFVMLLCLPCPGVVVSSQVRFRIKSALACNLLSAPSSHGRPPARVFFATPLLRSRTCIS